MASSRSDTGRYADSKRRRYRRSSFNGAKQLQAAGVKNRRMLMLVGLLVLALVAALLVVAMHLTGGLGAGEAPR